MLAHGTHFHTYYTYAHTQYDMCACVSNLFQLLQLEIDAMFCNQNINFSLVLCDTWYKNIYKRTSIISNGEIHRQSVM